MTLIRIVVRTGAIKRPFGSESISRPRKSERPQYFLGAFGRQFDDFGWYFGPYLIYKGVQKFSSLDINLNKITKNGVLDRVLNTYEFQLISDAKNQGLM